MKTQQNFINSFAVTGKADFRGNSLGAMPLSTRAIINDNLDIWQYHGHDGHLHGENPWWTYHEQFEPTLGKLLSVDGLIPEATVGNTLSTNNLVILLTFYRRLWDEYGEPPIIVTTETMFGSDQKTLEWILRIILGEERNINAFLIKISPGENGLYDFKSFENFLPDKPALGFFPGVCHITGQRFPIRELTQLFHKKGGYIGFDLAHSAGNHELSLHEDGVDFGTGGGYKYLNDGPGGTGFVYAHRKWYEDQRLVVSPGWWGIHKDVRFSRDANTPARGARRLLSSNDQINNSAGLLAYFKLVEEFGWEQVLSWNREISTYLIEQITYVDGVKVVTPYPWKERGCQVSFALPDRDILQVKKDLANIGCHCEDREWVLRVAPCAYNTKDQVDYFCNSLIKVLQ